MGMIFYTAVSYTTLMTTRQEFNDHVKDQERFQEQIPVLIQQTINTLNEEDDGLRSDVETADSWILRYEEMRERAIKAEILLKVKIDEVERTIK